MYDLFVGDVTEYLAHCAFQHDPAAQLLTTDSPVSGTYYTSVADCQSLEHFLSVCQHARCIYYCPPAKWSGVETQKWTEQILAFVGQSVSLHGALTLPKQYLTNNFLMDTRRTEEKQIWAVGCSITVGVGIDLPQTWKHLVQQQIGWPMSELNAPGSSIIWQSDQIVRSDIRVGDVVFWGLTSHHRVPIIVNNNIVHLNTRSFDQAPELLKLVTPEILDNDTLLYHNVLAVRRAKNFCDKIGARLIVLGLMHDFETVYAHYNITNFKQTIVWPSQYVDLGSDNLHPGPNQHQLYADEFIKLYETTSITSI